MSKQFSAFLQLFLLVYKIVFQGYCLFYNKLMAEIVGPVHLDTTDLMQARVKIFLHNFIWHHLDANKLLFIFYYAVTITGSYFFGFKSKNSKAILVIESF